LVHAEEKTKESKTPPTMPLTRERQLLTEDSRAVEPSDEAAVKELLGRLSREQMIDRIVERTKIVDPDNLHGLDPTDFSGHDDAAIARVYLVTEQEVDELDQDDPKTPGRQKKL